MDFRILGPLEVFRGNRRIRLGGTRERAVLALLLLHANEVVSSDRLIDRLWAGRPPLTAAKALQVYVSRLRNALGSDRIVTRAPGYLIDVKAGELDLQRFEQLVAQAQGAEPETASGMLREALSLWRGAPLADFAYEEFAQAEIARLDELRLAALEERVEADLARGLHGRLVGELEQLVSEHPLRERQRGQLMLALYRSGRQAEALAVYQDGLRLLDEELGLEPSERLKSLQMAILAHDRSLEVASAAGAGAEVILRERSILVFGRRLESFPALLTLAEVLARSDPPRELILAHVAHADALSAATSALHEQRGRLLSEGFAARAAAFSSPRPSDDFARLAAEYEVDLMLLDAGSTPLDDETKTILAGVSCDVALFLSESGPLRDGPIIAPFGAAEHDWAALELGAWVARATGAPLRLIGAAADGRADERDASRLLADASLIVQRTVGIPAEPLLARPGCEGVISLADGAGLLVVGLSERWRRDGLGKVRTEIAAAPPAPSVFVRRGVRPGGLAPARTQTRFTWSLTSAAAQ